MNNNKFIIPALALGLSLAACDEQKMEWQPSDPTIGSSDMPLELKEKIANYDFLKTYVQQYHPNINAAAGISADLYASDPDYKKVVDENFTGVTFGNAMKHQSVVTAKGDYNWATVDAALAIMPSDLKIYGHNMLWHTQQQQTYLKSLIAPEMKVEVSGDDVCINVIDNYGFENGDANNWTGLWGKYTYGVVSPGHDSNYCLHFEMTDETAQNYDSQLFWPTVLETGKTYAYEFWVKSDANLAVQFIGQNASYGGIYKDTFTAGSDWTYCTGEFEYKESDTKDIIRVGIQFGGTPWSNLWVDDFKFGEKNDAAAPTLINVLTGDASDFEGGTSGGWGSWGSNKDSDNSGVKEGMGNNGSYGLVLANKGDGNAWEAQCAYTFDEPLKKDVVYQLKFDAKCDNAAGELQFQYQNGTTYGSQDGYHTINVGTTWIPVEHEFTITEYDDVDRILLNFGKVGGVYQIDNIQFGEKIQQPAAAKRRAGGITYVLKTPEEKRQILLDAMEAWIKEAATHVGDRVDAWDVVNEPIHDNCKWRGFDGAFMSNGDDPDDSEPVESTESGLNLNWLNSTGNGHWYWGYYIGRDYAAKAFQFARQYAPNAKLFVNDYNLESNPGKLAALIEFVEYIDQNGGHVDGIGTQMHISTSTTREQIDAMFKTMAATGKLVRVTELDIKIGSATPSAEQLAQQAKVYQDVVESFLQNVPEAQQSGITFWTLTDHKREHEYWIPNDAPNLFDANYGRKHAYKTVCDAFAGYDVSTDFSGDDWKDAVAKPEEDEESAE